MFIAIGKDEMVNLNEILEIYFNEENLRINYWFKQKPNEKHFVPFLKKNDFLSEKEKILQRIFFYNEIEKEFCLKQKQ